MDMVSAKQPYIYPVKGVIKGIVPKWIQGSLYRIGPGKFEVGMDKYKHLFDGLGMIQRYWFNDGEVTFNSEYVHSDTYMKNMIANRIVVSEFGTVALPDPCQSIFNRVSSIFDSTMTDNTNVCVYPLGDELFSATETNVIHRINQQDLSTIGSVRLDKVLAIHRATAHQHIDPGTGLVHLLGFINSPPGYAFVTLPPIKREQSKELNNKYDMEHLLNEARIMGKVAARWKLNPSYCHSFGITENFYILFECPLTLNILEMLKTRIWSATFSNTIQWWPREKTKIHLINRNTGESVPNTYVTDAMFNFHHINSYEDNNHVVIDYCGYDDGNIIIDLMKESLSKKGKENVARATARRLVIPLHVDREAGLEENLNKLNGATATSKIILKDKNHVTIHCSQEELASGTYIELPSINYSVYNSKKYRYVYGTGHDKLIKIDVVTKETLEWKSEVTNCMVGEPVFLRDPSSNENNPDDEDLGVILSPVIYDEELVGCNRYQSLIIIDTKSMTEVARAEFKSVSIPLTFHGVFLNKP